MRPALCLIPTAAFARRGSSWRRVYRLRRYLPVHVHLKNDPCLHRPSDIPGGSYGSWRRRNGDFRGTSPGAISRRIECPSSSVTGESTSKGQLLRFFFLSKGFAGVVCCCCMSVFIYKITHNRGIRPCHPRHSMRVCFVFLLMVLVYLGGKEGEGLKIE